VDEEAEVVICENDPVTAACAGSRLRWLDLLLSFDMLKTGDRAGDGQVGFEL